MKQLFTSFYCPHCEGKGQKREDSKDMGVEWKFIGHVLHIEYGINMVTIDYMDTKSVKDRICVSDYLVQGIDKITTGMYTQNSLHLYKHSLVENIFKIAGVGIK